MCFFGKKIRIHNRNCFSKFANSDFFLPKKHTPIFFETSPCRLPGPPISIQICPHPEWRKKCRFLVGFACKKKSKPFWIAFWCSIPLAKKVSWLAFCSGSGAAQQFVGQRNGVRSEQGKGFSGPQPPRHTQITRTSEARPLERASKGPRGPRVK